jgi:transmembrane sensor
MKKLDSGITIKPQWDKTPDEIWNERFAALTDDEKGIGGDEEPKKTIGLWKRTIYIWSVAAAVLIIVTASAFLYTKEIKGLPGKTCCACLPDGSQVQLAAGSTIIYHPRLWIFSHSVKMEGEAYFSGHHAKGFSVKTEEGVIDVLGTAFNARTYDSKLIVTCIDGKVEVRSGHAATELTAGMEATMCNGKLATEHVANAESTIGWTKGIFSFTDRPMTEVLKDVGRYYGMKIGAPQGADTLRYTGRFTQREDLHKRSARHHRTAIWS